MSDDSLRQVLYKAVVLSNLLYALPAWWGHTNASAKSVVQIKVTMLAELLRKQNIKMQYQSATRYSSISSATILTASAVCQMS